MDENTIKSSIELYNTQLEQVEQAILAAGENEDLVKLRDDLKELIELTTDSLLSLKKGLLLQSLESTSSSGQPSSSQGQGQVDDEYAAFQAALGEHVTSKEDISTNQNTSIDESTNENGSMSTNEKLDEALSDLEGMRCRAPFQQDWGCLVYSNALILSVNPMLDDTETPSVKVMFCNPTNNSMAPCQFYLEDRCKYTDGDCRNSHGYTVKLEDLQEYQEPDYSTIKIESKVLGLYEDDGLWYKGTVIDNINNEGEIHVLFDGYDETATLKLEQILPLDPDIISSSEESDNEDDYVPLDKSDSEDEDCLPVFLWRPPKTTARLGEWEDHTRGIGSKLMSKMGYIVGQGLGKEGQGIAEPVPIQLIPKGKSLDKIMELKELAGDQDLFDVMKKSKKKKIKKSGTSNSNISVKPAKSTDVFDFINKKLRGKKGNLHELRKHPSGGQSGKLPSKKHISEQDLHSKSDRHLNIQLLKTDEELRNVNKELKRLKESLARNQNRDHGAATKIQAKITSLEEYKRKLQTSEQTLSRHKQRRSDHKKLTIF